MSDDERMACDAASQEERAKVADKLSKWKLEEVNRTLDLLDIPRGSGSKVTWQNSCTMQNHVDNTLSCNTKKDSGAVLLHVGCCSITTH